MQRSDHRPPHHDTDPHVLAGRLATGWVMIEAEPNPTKREKLEDHWIRLLRSYENACDRAAATGERGAA